jgi:hypothetical protein
MEDIAMAALGLVGAATVAVVAVWLLTRLVRTIVELKKITTGLATLGWALRNLPADPPVVHGIVANGRKLGSG